MGLSNELSHEGRCFSCCHLNPHRCFQSVLWGFISPCWNPGLGSLSWSLPSVALPTPLHILMPHWVCQPPSCHESSLPHYLSLPLLPIWMNVSSLTPWLLDFHTVQFSVSSGCSFLFKLLLSFFWLCKEAQCVHLCLHLGQKCIYYFKKSKQLSE